MARQKQRKERGVKRKFQRPTATEKCQLLWACDVIIISCACRVLPELFNNDQQESYEINDQSYDFPIIRKHSKTVNVFLLPSSKRLGLPLFCSFARRVAISHNSSKGAIITDIYSRTYINNPTIST